MKKVVIMNNVLLRLKLQGRMWWVTGFEGRVSTKGDQGHEGRGNLESVGGEVCVGSLGLIFSWLERWRLCLRKEERVL